MPGTRRTTARPPWTTSLSSAFDSVHLRMAGDAATVAALAVVLVGLCTSPMAATAVSVGTIRLVLTLVAVGVATGATILANQCARLAGDAATGTRLDSVTAGLAVYALVVLPVTVVGGSAAASGAASGAAAAGSAAICCALALLAWGMRRGPRRGPSRAWLVGGAVLAAAAAAAIAGTVAAVRAVLTPPLPTPVIVLGGVGVAAWYLVRGLRAADPLRWRIGLGLTTLTAANLIHQVLLGAPGATDADLAYAALRVLAVATFACAFSAGARSMLLDLRTRERRVAAQAVASLDTLRRTTEQAAERDHEMRNLVAGLAGVSHLLGHRHAGRHPELAEALRAELHRLSDLLDGGRAAAGTPAYTDVGDTLTQHVLLRAAAGTEVDVVAGPGLTAAVPPSVLAQVVVNLLANCERHAPGAAVHVRARRVGQDVRVEVHDEGRTAAAARSVFPRGPRDAGTGGLGVGLALSADLLRPYDGTLRLGPSPRYDGTVAVVDLPAAGR